MSASASVIARARVWVRERECECASASVSARVHLLLLLQLRREPPALALRQLQTQGISQKGTAHRQTRLALICRSWYAVAHASACPPIGPVLPSCTRENCMAASRLVQLHTYGGKQAQRCMEKALEIASRLLEMVLRLDLFDLGADKRLRRRKGAKTREHQGALTARGEMRWKHCAVRIERNMANHTRENCLPLLEPGLLDS
eukprot:5088201-Pleurochrysis_carterae.AAC.1